jgi:hypothetical protein
MRTLALTALLVLFPYTLLVYAPVGAILFTFCALRGWIEV